MRTYVHTYLLSYFYIILILYSIAFIYRRVPYVLYLKRALGFIFTLKITEKKFLRENTISSNTAFNINLIIDSDSAEFSKEFGLFELLCLAFIIEIFTAGGTEHGKNHFFDPKLHLNLTS